ncbi:hypothetical protein, partial [Klebsiella pneumoniae]|uniref:hypothetical protein n=1 Tax=Klebsiella pneumoniae TaxID=573 RepID=UPI001C703970
MLHDQMVSPKTTLGQQDARSQYPTTFLVMLPTWGQFGYRKLLYYKGFPGVSTPVFMVSVCSSV